MRTPEITGSWTGEFVGALRGSMTLELNQAGNRITGIARLHEPSLGRSTYRIKGDIRQGGPHQLTFTHEQGAANLGTLHTLCWLETDGSLTVRWKSEDGKQGEFIAHRLAGFAASKTFPASPQTPLQTKPAPLPPTKPARAPLALMPEKHAGLSLQKIKPVLFVSGKDTAVRHIVRLYLEKIGVDATNFGEYPQPDPVAEAQKFDLIPAHTRYAVVLLTPDDVAYPSGRSGEKRPRPSQNIVWELGYLAAKLGRDNLLVLTKGELDLPEDVLGLGYEPIDHGEGWKLRLARELKTAGFQIDLNGAL